MAYLSEVVAWDAGVYQIEVEDKVIGGADGIVNLAAKALANRTAYLKNRSEAHDAALSQKAPLDSPALTGTPTAPTPAGGDNTGRIATTAFVQAAILALIDSSPAALDTLNELAAALADDPNFATTMTNALALKAPLASPDLTGTPTAPTADPDTETQQIASTAFVLGQASGDDPLTLGVASPGTSKKFSRADHVHPSDPTRAPVENPTFTGLALVNGDGIGYATGAGGAVVQATSKTTGVTLNKATGKITMHSSAIAAGAAIRFRLTNSKIGYDDVVVVSIRSGATSFAYNIQVETIYSGFCEIVVRNVSGSSLSEAIVLNFAVIKGASA